MHGKLLLATYNGTAISQEQVDRLQKQIEGLRQKMSRIKQVEAMMAEFQAREPLVRYVSPDRCQGA